jgi:hypothetical protein
MRRSRFLNHVTLPSIVPALFLLIASTPVEVLGCRNRGLAALALALLSASLGLFSAVKALNLKRQGSHEDKWWVISALIFTIAPLILIKIA